MIFYRISDIPYIRIHILGLNLFISKSKLITGASCDGFCKKKILGELNV